VACAHVVRQMSPVVTGKDPCQRCGQYFQQEENGPYACRHHALDTGEQGEFRVLSEEEVEAAIRAGAK
jgi:hypothetical protein